jgi:hypothetical protein
MVSLFYMWPAYATMLVKPNTYPLELAALAQSTLLGYKLESVSCPAHTQHGPATATLVNWRETPPPFPPFPLFPPPIYAPHPSFLIPRFFPPPSLSLSLSLAAVLCFAPKPWRPTAAAAPHQVRSVARAFCSQSFYRQFFD